MTGAVDPDQVRQLAAAGLPGYMVPDVLMVLGELPLTGSGKIDRRALPEPVLPGPVFRAPSSAVEQTLTEVFAEVLGLERVGVNDDFFALGGDSIVSIQVVAQGRARGVVFGPRDVFEQRTAARLAVIAGAAGAGTVPELPGGGVGELPLLPVAQWMVAWGRGYDRFDQHVVLRLSGDMEYADLVAAVDALLDRHDMLRSRLERAAGGEFSLLVRPAGSLDAATLVRRHTLESGSMCGNKPPLN